MQTTFTMSLSSNGIRQKGSSFTTSITSCYTRRNSYLLPYSTQKSANGQNGTIAKIDTIGNNSFYYTLNMQTTDKTVSCPIMNGNGEVLGLIQKILIRKVKKAMLLE